MNTEQTIAAEEALRQLAAQAPSTKPLLKFTEIGQQIIASLIKAADEQVEAAHKLREDVLQLAESIGETLEAQAKRMEAMDMRTKEFGLAVLDAHKKFINGGEHDNPTP